jgi:hypothetical protein
MKNHWTILGDERGYGKGVYLHNYETNWDSWALLFSLTTRNFSVQIGPFLFQIFWRWL